MTPHVNPAAIEAAAAAKEDQANFEARRAAEVDRIRARLVDIFTHHNPRKVADVEKLLYESVSYTHLTLPTKA